MLLKDKNKMRLFGLARLITIKQRLEPIMLDNIVINGDIYEIELDIENIEELPMYIQRKIITYG